MLFRKLLILLLFVCLSMQAQETISVKKVRADSIMSYLGTNLSLFARRTTSTPYQLAQRIFNDSTLWYVDGLKKMTLDSTGLKAQFISQTGSVISGSHLVDGSVIAQKLGENAQGFSTDIVFSATDNNTVAWTAGGLRFSQYYTWSIQAGNTGDMTGFVYIYFNALVSGTVLQVTTDFLVATGERSQILCVAKPASSANQLAFFVSAVGVLGVNETNISANSISADKIQANTITAGKLNVSDLSAISADMGTLTAGSIVVGDVSNKLWLNDFGDGALNIGGSVKANAPFKVTNTGLLTVTGATIKTAASGKYIDIGSGIANEMQFFEGDVSKVRIGSSVYYNEPGIYLTNGVFITLGSVGGFVAKLGSAMTIMGYAEIGMYDYYGGHIFGVASDGKITTNSNSLVANLNADLLDGSHASAFATSGHTHSYPVTSVFGRTGAVTASGTDYSGHYAAIDHNHSSEYSAIGHDHSGVYSSLGHNHNGTYATPGFVNDEIGDAIANHISAYH